MNIKNKKQLIKENVVAKHGCSSGICLKCANTLRFIDKMDDANIPINYWFYKLSEFENQNLLHKILNEYVNNIKKEYLSGRSLCFSGNQGVGKTMASVIILKEAIKNGFSTYYTTATDMLDEIINNENVEYKYKIKSCDFLTMDEVDSRFFINNSSKELFSSVFEWVFRYRSNNGLPTVICTNETKNPLDVFYGMGKESMASLYSQYVTIYTIAGIDNRRQGK